MAYVVKAAANVSRSPRISDGACPAYCSSSFVSAFSDADPFELCAASACETFVPSERSFVQLAEAENEYDEEDDDELELELDEELDEEPYFDEDEVTQKAGARIDLDLEGLLAIPRSLGYHVSYRRAERPPAVAHRPASAVSSA